MHTYLPTDRPTEQAANLFATVAAIQLRNRSRDSNASSRRAKKPADGRRQSPHLKRQQRQSPRKAIIAVKEDPILPLATTVIVSVKLIRGIRRLLLSQSTMIVIVN